MHASPSHLACALLLVTALCYAHAFPKPLVIKVRMRRAFITVMNHQKRLPLRDI